MAHARRFETDLVDRWNPLECFGPQGIVMRVHTAFDLLAGRLTQVKVTDCHEGEHLEVFELQKGDLVVTIGRMAYANASSLFSPSLLTLSFASAHRSFPWRMSKEKHLWS